MEQIMSILLYLENQSIMTVILNAVYIKNETNKMI